MFLFFLIVTETAILTFIDDFATAIIYKFEPIQATNPNQPLPNM